MRSDQPSNARGTVRHDAQVIVVGAGPAGSATAAFLARAGVDVLLLDRAHFPRPKPCAECVSPQASRILDSLGVLGTLERSGAALLAGMEVRAPSGGIIRGCYAAPLPARPYRDRGLSVLRTTLDPLILGAARDAGAGVVEGARVSELLRGSDGRVEGVRILDAAGPRELRAPLVVGADGLRSVVARRLGLARTARWPRRLALVTHYGGVAGVGAFGEMHVERDGFIGIADVGRGLSTVALVVPAGEAARISGDTAGYLEAWIAAHPHLAQRFTRAERATPVLATGPFASHSRQSWAPGAALVGDAADFFDPFTGEGVYSALRGAELLAQALIEDGMRGDDATLRRYHATRRQEFRGKWRLERAVGLATTFTPLMNHAARAAQASPWLGDLVVGVCGDFVHPRELLRPRALLGALLPRRAHAPA